MTFLSIQFYIKADNDSEESLNEEYFLYLLRFIISCHQILTTLSAILMLAEQRNLFKSLISKVRTKSVVNEICIVVINEHANDLVL